jgi:GAF domain-containing protein
LADDRLNAAVAAGALAGEEAHRALLRSIVEVARVFFAAKAASITLLDEEADELVFEAVAGEGSDALVGTRLPATQGIAGWVVAARQPLVLDEVSKDPRFSRQAAESTGYVPKALLAVPLLRGDRVLGALSVLDRADESVFGLEEMELLELFADQAAIALDIVQSARGAARALEGSGDVAVVSRLAAALDGLEGSRREAATRMLGSLVELLSGADAGPG